jgi:O-antigen ligase
VQTKAMKNNNFESLNLYNRVILVGVALTTIYILPSVQDPFNSPKSWILLLLSIFLIPILTNSYQFSRKKIILSFSFIYFSGLLVGYFFSDNKLISFFGDIQRKNGLLSYISLLIIWLAIIFNFQKNLIERFEKVLLVVALICASYGVLQSYGLDFISWDNPYNSMISTLGNPNFAAALLACLSSYIFILIFDLKQNLVQKVLYLIVLLVSIFAIILSTARQGILAFLFGGSIGLYFLIPLTKKLLRNTYVLSILIFAFFSVAGMLQHGLFSKFLYKDSISVRGYYWRAAWKMFQNYPLTGIGLDRYGYYFKEFREVGYPQRYGFTITSSAAHNVFLQFFSTGGLLLGFGYLSLVLLTLYFGYQNIRQSTGREKSVSNALLSAYITFLAQSLISIDNVGISIWGWSISGLICGLYFYRKEKVVELKKITRKKLSIKSSLIQPLVSLFLLIPAIILVSNMYKSERAIYLYRASGGLASSLPEIEKKNIVEIIANSKFTDQRYKVLLGTDYYQFGQKTAGINMVEQLVSDDSRDLDALNNLSLMYEDEKTLEKAIYYRNRIMKLDPWGGQNILQLAIDYKAMGDIEKSKELKVKILSFASGLEVGNLAKQLL